MENFDSVSIKRKSDLGIPNETERHQDCLQELTLPLSSLLPSCMPAKGHMTSAISYSWTSFCFYLCYPLGKAGFVSGIAGY